MLISALCAQFSYAFRIVFDAEHPHIELENLMEGLFCAGAVMISYGAVRARSFSPGSPNFWRVTHLDQNNWTGAN